MEVNYYKENHHNYLIVRNTEENPKVDYHKKMLSIRCPSNILTFSSRIVDGESYNYYDITSKLTLRQLYGSRLIDMDDIRQLLDSIKAVFEETENLLLDTDRIVLDPDYIYYAFGSFKYYFLYNVSDKLSGYEEGEDEKGLGKLMDYLLEQVSTQDSVATKFVYDSYDYFEKGNFDIWDMFELLPKEESADNSCIPVNLETEKEENIIDNNLDSYPVADTYDYDFSYNNEQLINSKTHAVSMEKMYLLMIIAGGIVVVASLVIYFTMLLDEKEMLILISCAGVGLVITIAGAAFKILSYINKKRDRQNEKENEAIGGEHFLYDNEDISANIKMTDFVDNRHTRNKMQRENENLIKDDEQTVFFEPDYSHDTFKLFAMDKHNKQHILLDRFPYTIGKMSGYVDCCLEHPSISRLHARIDRTDDALTLSDLNSTNGVFLNGMRLTPNQRTIIEPGDEIKIGGLNYCLRNCG